MNIIIQCIQRQRARTSMGFGEHFHLTKHLYTVIVLLIAVPLLAFSRSASPRTRQKAQPFIAAGLGLMVLVPFVLTGADFIVLVPVALFAGLAVLMGRAVKICPNCGLTNYPNFFTPAEYCNKCGASLDVEVSPHD